MRDHSSLRTPFWKLQYGEFEFSQTCDEIYCCRLDVPKSKVHRTLCCRDCSRLLTCLKEMRKGHYATCETETRKRKRWCAHIVNWGLKEGIR